MFQNNNLKTLSILKLIINPYRDDLERGFEETILLVIYENFAHVILKNTIFSIIKPNGLLETLTQNNLFYL